MTIRPLDIIAPATPVLPQNGGVFTREGEELSREALLAQLGIGGPLVGSSHTADAITTDHAVASTRGVENPVGSHERTHGETA